MRGFIERLRGYESQIFNRGGVIVEKKFIRQPVNYVEERILELTCKSGKVAINFNNFLPEGWEFREEDGLLSAWEGYGRKVIWLPDVIAAENIYKTPFLPSRSSLRSSESSGEASHVFLLMKGAFFGLLHGLAHVLEEEDVSGDLFSEEIRLREMHEERSLRQFSEEDRERYREIVIGSERRAWDGAYEMLEKFRSDGLDLEPEMSDADLRLFVEGNIKSYLM